MRPAEAPLVAPHRPVDPDQFVGQRDRSLVVANARGGFKAPALQASEFFRRSRLTALRGQQRHPCAMDQQGAHIGIALSTDMPELSALPAAELAGRHAQPGAKLATIGEALGLAYDRLQGAGGEHTYR